MQSHILQLDDKQLHYRTVGEGEAVVWLHGYLEDSRIWEPFVSRWSNYRFVLLDMPGHGLSDAHAEQSMESMAEAVIAVVEHENLERVHLVGHSMGGYVALAIADLRPDLLKSLCLFHSHCFADTPEAMEKRLREIALVEAGKKELLAIQNIPQAFAQEFLFKHAAEMARAQAIAREQKADGVVACLRAMRQRANRCEVWNGLTIKTMLIAGLQDSFIPQSRVLEMTSKAAHSVCMLPQAGHMGFVEQAETAYNALTDFWAL